MRRFPLPRDVLGFPYKQKGWYDYVILFVDYNTGGQCILCHLHNVCVL